MVCSKCQEHKDPDEMSRDRVVNGEIKYRSYCKACRVKDYKEKTSGKEMPWSERVRKIKARANKRGIECTITADHLASLWQVQGGLCAYTKENMLITYGLRNHPKVVSVDRIHPDLGYVPGNVVLCTSRANSIKQDMTPREFKIWMPLWYLRLRRLRKKIEPVSQR